ncbi:MAG: transposase [Phycisphaera sp.]|nr:transposase [Phycisphaera sp.]
MPDYRRNRVAGGTYFFTVNLLNRREGLLVENIDALRGAMDRVMSAHPFHIDAMVVLPDHLHCVLTLPTGDDRYDTRWNQIKGLCSRSLPSDESRSRSRRKKCERGIWQRRYWEHTIRDEGDYAAHVDYIHYNPVKHGYVARPVDGPHSSIHRFIKLGILDAHWGTSGIDTTLNLE